MQTSSSRRTSHPHWARLLGAAGTTVVAVAAVMATAGAADAATASAPIFASGSVAALSTSSMEVQNASSGQTTVSWTLATQFSKNVTETVSSLTVGDCVTAMGTASKKSKTTIAAHSISVTSATSTGSCGGQGGGPVRLGSGTGANGAAPFGGGGSGSFRVQGGGGPPGGESNGSHPNFPGGGSGANNFRKQFANTDIASGKVTAVKGSTITVSGITLNAGSSFAHRTTKSNSKTKQPARPKAEKLTITTSASTPVSATESTTSSALAVGDCVSAIGPGASNGAVTANTVRITSTGGASCTGGFVGGGGFYAGGGPGGAGGPGGQVSGSGA